MTRMGVMIWWTLIALTFAFGTFMIVVNYGAHNASDVESGRFHAAVLTVTSSGEQFDFEFMEAISFYEAHTRAEEAWSKKSALTMNGAYFAAGTVDRVSSKVTTHMAWPHYELSRDWAENIDLCTCRGHKDATLLERFRMGLAAMGLMAAPVENVEPIVHVGG